MLIYADGTHVVAGDKVTTWGKSTVWDVIDIDGVLHLKGYKALSEINCTPVKVTQSEWQPISTAPRDYTSIEIYWFAAKMFLIARWDADLNLWDGVYYDKIIPAHIKKAIWRPVTHPKYEDYKHLF